MVKGREIEEKLRVLRGGRLLFLPHAIQQMTRPDRMISRQEVRNVVEHGEIIEDYPREEEVMKCIHCQGTLKRGRAPIHIDRNGCHITIDNVPAWICEQCGEPLFEEQEVEAIQDIVKAVDEKCRLLQRSA